MKPKMILVVVLVALLLGSSPAWAGGPEPVGLTQIEPGWAPGTAVSVLPGKAMRASPAADAPTIWAGDNGESTQIATLEATGRQSYGVAVRLSINGYFPILPTGDSVRHWKGIKWAHWTDLTRQPLAAKKPANRKILSSWIFW